MSKEQSFTLEELREEYDKYIEDQRVSVVMFCDDFIEWLRNKYYIKSNMEDCYKIIKEFRNEFGGVTWLGSDREAVEDFWISKFIELFDLRRGVKV